MFIKQWESVLRQYCRLTVMEDGRLNKLIFLWADKLSNRNKNWNYKVLQHIQNLNLGHCLANNTTFNIHFKQFIRQMSENSMDQFVNKWQSDF